MLTPAFPGNVQDTTNRSALGHNDDIHQCSVENDIEQPRDYCEISDKVKTVPNIITMENLATDANSNYYCVTPQPEEGEYENSSAVSLECSDSLYC